MPNLKISLWGCAFILALVVPAAAYMPKQGETCGATTSGNARTINGKAYSCDATTCSSCSTSGSAVNNCINATHYDNCAEAKAATSPQKPPPIKAPPSITAPIKQLPSKAN
jgi:hypothetical protein